MKIEQLKNLQPTYMIKKNMYEHKSKTRTESWIKIEKTADSH